MRDKADIRGMIKVGDGEQLPSETGRFSSENSPNPVTPLKIPNQRPLGKFAVFRSGDVGKSGLGLGFGRTEFSPQRPQRNAEEKNGECGEFSLGFKNQNPAVVFLEFLFLCGEFYVLQGFAESSQLWPFPVHGRTILLRGIGIWRGRLCTAWVYVAVLSPAWRLLGLSP